jgi:hypothetical protein
MCGSPGSTFFENPNRYFQNSKILNEKYTSTCTHHPDPAVFLKKMRYILGYIKKIREKISFYSYTASFSLCAPRR